MKTKNRLCTNIMFKNFVVKSKKCKNYTSAGNRTRFCTHFLSITPRRRWLLLTTEVLWECFNCRQKMIIFWQIYQNSRWFCNTKMSPDAAISPSFTSGFRIEWNVDNRGRTYQIYWNSRWFCNRKLSWSVRLLQKGSKIVKLSIFVTIFVVLINFATLWNCYWVFIRVCCKKIKWVVIARVCLWISV